MTEASKISSFRIGIDTETKMEVTLVILAIGQNGEETETLKFVLQIIWIKTASPFKISI